MRAGRTGRHDRMIGTLETMFDRHITRGEIDQAAWNEERRHPSRAALMQNDRCFRNAGQAADTRTNHRARSAAIRLVVGMPIGVVESLASRAHGVENEVIDLALILRLHPVIRIEGAVRTVATRNHASDLAGQVGNLERIDFPGAAVAVEDALPGWLDATAERRDHAKAGDDNPSHLDHSGPLAV